MTTIDITGTVHELKCWPTMFEAIADGRKPFDIRKADDREYAPGDVLRFREWNPDTAMYTGRTEAAVVTYVYDPRVEGTPLWIEGGVNGNGEGEPLVVLGLSIGGIEI